MLGRVMELQPIQDALGFGRLEDLVQCGRIMGVEVILNQPNPDGVWEVDIDEVAHAVGPVLLGAVFSRLNVAPVVQGAKNMNRFATPLRMFVVVALGLTLGW